MDPESTRAESQEEPSASRSAASRSSIREEWVIFAVLAVLGTAAYFLRVKIPYTEAFIEGRWVFGFMGFALLTRWWMALLLAGLLSMPYLSRIEFLTGFLGNMLYALPALLTIRVVETRVLSARARSWWVYGTGWFLLSMLCYQVFNTPAVWAVIAVLQNAPVWPAILEGWRIQPFLFEGLLVSVISGLGMVAMRTNSQLRNSRERLTHINRILMSMRNVNQLILTETDPGPLIERVCAELTGAIGYDGAWIVLLDQNRERAIRFSASGFDGGVEEMRARLERGQFPSRLREVVGREGVCVFLNHPADCPECPLAGECAGRAGMVRRISFGNRVFGIIGVSAPLIYAHDREEQELFNDVASDLGFALHKIEGAEELLRSEERYRTLFQSGLNPILIVDMEGRCVDANRSALDFLETGRDQLLGENTIRGCSIHDLIEKEKETRDPFLTPWTVEALFDVNGRQKTLLLNFAPIQKNGETTLLGIGQDLTEKLQLEAQLRQAQKLESVGRLAGGVAHDFNNMLTVILGQTEMVLKELDPKGPFHQRLLQVQQSARRSAQLVHQLLAFARKQNISPVVLDLNHTVEGILKMLGRLIGEDIHLAWMPGNNLWLVRMDPSQIDQILANLCVNARDAIDNVGTITIETRNVVIDDAYCAAHEGSLTGEYVLLSVSDDGCGMGKPVLENLFEPFFTTKGVGKGTGLGLATVYGIVKQNEGFINVYSEPGQGTVFKIYLPRHRGRVPDQDATGKPEALRLGRETVLLVEDSAMLLEIGKSMLEILGYRVLTGSTPEEANRLAEIHGDQIHLLMTDVVMPGMNGRDLAKRLLSLHPSLKCLFMSGYTADVIAHRGVLDPNVHFIQKPFTLHALSMKVREALDAEA